MTDLDRILALRVDLTDADACAQITPEMAAVYLAGKGWTRLTTITEKWQCWNHENGSVDLPLHPTWSDYGQWMVRALRDVSATEQRSPLAVWLDMTAQGAEKETDEARLAVVHERIANLPPRAAHEARRRMSRSYSESANTLEREGCRIEGDDVVWSDGERYPRRTT